jgi:hypothetical protein
MTRNTTKYNGFLIISNTDWNQEWFAIGSATGLYDDSTTLTTSHHTTEENAVRTMENMIDDVRRERS